MPVRGFIAWIFGNGKTLCEADTLSGGSLHERSWEKEAFTSCLLVLILTGKFIYPDAEASPSLETGEVLWHHYNLFQGIIKES